MLLLCREKVVALSRTHHLSKIGIGGKHRQNFEKLEEIDLRTWYGYLALTYPVVGNRVFGGEVEEQEQQRAIAATGEGR